MCANIISLLSDEAAGTGTPSIDAVSNHSVTIPCALPIGLPYSIREKLLFQYRNELRRRLFGLQALEGEGGANATG